MAKYQVTKFKKEDPRYNKDLADYAVSFIECLSHQGNMGRKTIQATSLTGVKHQGLVRSREENEFTPRLGLDLVF